MTIASFIQGLYFTKQATNILLRNVFLSFMHNFEMSFLKDAFLFFLMNFLSTMSQRYSIGFISGYWCGYINFLMPFSPPNLVSFQQVFRQIQTRCELKNKNGLTDLKEVLGVRVNTFVQTVNDFVLSLYINRCSFHFFEYAFLITYR